MTPLEALERIKSHNYHEHSKKECLEVIETALKEYAGFQIVFKLSNRNEGKKVYDKLKAFEMIHECFMFNGFDELIPLPRWWKISEEDQYFLREIINETIRY